MDRRRSGTAVEPVQVQPAARGPADSGTQLRSNKHLHRYIKYSTQWRPGGSIERVLLADRNDGVTEVQFGITSASPKTSSEAESVVENILQNNEMEVKLFEATFCGFVLLTKAETT